MGFRGQRLAAVPDAATYGRDREELLRELRSRAGGAPWSERLYSPYAFCIQRDEADRMRRVCHAVGRGLQVVVEQYFHDDRIADRIPLAPWICEILQSVSRLPYRIGTYRPDFMFDGTDSFRICEINARYPANGLAISYTMEGAFRATRVGRDVARTAMADSFDIVRTRFDLERPIGVVKERETGRESFVLLNGLDARSVAPAALELRDGVLHADERPIDQFVLEMDREELRLLHPSVRREVFGAAACLSDVRTMILVHDKRTLSVLGDRTLMRDHLTDEDCELLARHIVPTFGLDDPSVVEAILDDPTRWVLKVNSGGRGAGMRVGRNHTADEMRQFIASDGATYHAQHFVEQPFYPVVHMSDGDPVVRQMNVVGMLPCFDEHAFGLGIFRGSTGTIINVHSGHGTILPSVELNHTHSPADWQRA